MKTRSRALPAGWYPDGAEETISLLDSWRDDLEREREADGVSVVVPHAGWYFSGELAFKTMALLDRSVETVVVVGGHLPPKDLVTCHGEDAAETPMGPIAQDKEVLAALDSEFRVQTDETPDNTVEVQLPMVKYLFSDAKYVGLRVSPTALAIDVGASLRRLVNEGKKRIAVVGSTDLTHYGAAYGFAPRGTGREAERWVSEVNDRTFLDALLEMRLQDALSAAADRRAACSAGAAVAAAEFAREAGVASGTLVGHETSASRGGWDSFVGYGGVAFQNSSSTVSTS